MASNKEKLLDEKKISKLHKLSSNAVSKKYAKPLHEAIDKFDDATETILKNDTKRLAPIKDIKKYMAKRDQDKAVKAYLASIKASSKSVSKTQGRSRLTSLSKGKKILSYRSEKDYLKASNEQTRKMISALLKQGYAKESKQIHQLEILLHTNDVKMKHIDSSIDAIKGGDKRRASELLKLEAKAADLKKLIDQRSKHMEHLIASNEEQIRELLDEGFNESDDVILALRKEQEIIKKNGEAEISDLEEKNSKLKSEMETVKSRSSDVGLNKWLLGGTTLAIIMRMIAKMVPDLLKDMAPKIAELAMKNPKLTIATATAGALAEDIHQYGQQRVDKFGVQNKSTVGNSKVATLWEMGRGWVAGAYRRYVMHEGQPKSSAQKHALDMPIKGFSVDQVKGLEMEGVNAYEGSSYIYDDVGNIALGNGLNLAQNSPQTLRAMGIDEKYIQILTPYLQSPLSKFTYNRAEGLKQLLSSNDVGYINAKYIASKSNEFNKILFGKGKYLLDGGLSATQLATLRAAYHNAPGLTEQMILGAKSLPQFLNMWDRDFRTSGDYVRVKDKKTGAWIVDGSGKKVRDRYNVRNPNPDIVGVIKIQNANLSAESKDTEKFVKERDEELRKEREEAKKKTVIEDIKEYKPTHRGGLFEERVRAYGIDRTAEPSLIGLPNAEENTNIRKAETKVDNAPKENVKPENNGSVNDGAVTTERTLSDSHQKSKSITQGSK